MNHFWDQIKNSDMFNFQDVYRDAVLRCDRGGTIVELGSWVGQSLAYLIVEALNAQKDIRVVSVEAFLGNVHGGEEVKERPQWDLFKKNLAPVWKHVIAIKSLSYPAAAFFADGAVDTVFVDADHHFEAVAADLYVWWPKVKAGGWLAGHDFQHPPIKQALALFGTKNLVRWTVRGNSWVIEKPA